MKKVIIFIALLSLAAMAEEVRVSVMFVHYSVGGQIVRGDCYDDEYNDNIREALDTANVMVGEDTARIVFRSYHMNYDAARTPLSDTLHGTAQGGCAEVYFSNFDYDLNDPYNRTIIWSSWDGQHDEYAGLLKYMFQIPNKEDSLFWRMFGPHNVPGTNGDSVLENYDLIIVKNPYACWAHMSTAQSDSIKKFYRAVRDSLVNHPEINFAFAFGTPHRLGGDGVDTIQAKITYQLATWFASDSFFTHTNDGPYKNIWKWDSYRHMCELSPGAPNRYCLKTEYWLEGDQSSHLSNLGADVEQDSLIAFISRAAEDILYQRTGIVTRQDIDRKIKAFRDGNATLEEVLDLIARYNQGGG